MTPLEVLAAYKSMYDTYEPMLKHAQMEMEESSTMHACAAYDSLRFDCALDAEGLLHNAVRALATAWGDGYRDGYRRGAHDGLGRGYRSAAQNPYELEET